MGEAKRRGDRGKRVEQAVERASIKSIACNDCGTTITAIEHYDTRRIPGLDVACVGKCPQCSALTYAVHGTAEAKEFFAQFLSEQQGISPAASAQLLLPRKSAG